jgi:coenzyme F420-reducing hydrogenase delta subunit
MASEEPQKAVEKLAKILKSFKVEHERVARDRLSSRGLSKEMILNGVAALVTKIRDVNPLVHQVRA